ncbi:hypothetical protein ACSQ96_22625, partial [Salmonella enterica]|uniref:hypothetical protein n=1 Tax=Salmonella enterica TaxID=28901 RepID=UPI003EDB7BAA
ITTGKSKPIFKSFGIDHLDDHLIDNDKIVLLGVNQPDWQHYFEWKRQKQIKVVPGIKILNIPGFQIKTIQ